MACVAYLSVAVIAHDGVSPYEFLFYRVVDTFLGVGIGSLVGSFHTHGKKRNDVLFVAELDDELRSAHRQISEFNKTALNHMIDEGALFTMITRQTPASLIAEVEHLKLRLPVIALDGAVLYDIYQNRYLHACLMEHDMGIRIRQLLTEQNRAFFTNVIVDDVWVIYYNDLVDEDQKGYLKKLRTSPYRNYMKRAPHDEDHILYFSVLDTHNRLIMLEKQLEEMGFAGKLKFLLEDHVFGEKSLLKILSIEASPRNMLDRLMKMLHVHHSIVYGDKDSETCCDVAVADSDFNRIVQNIRSRLYRKKKKDKSVQEAGGHPQLEREAIIMLTSVTGINWGDEGKGRIVDLLTEKADYVVRYQGGNNAGYGGDGSGKICAESASVRYPASDGSLCAGKRYGDRSGSSAP